MDFVLYALMAIGVLFLALVVIFCFVFGLVYILFAIDAAYKASVRNQRR